MSMRLLRISMMCAVVLGTSGCSEKSPRVPVAGKVLIDGKPLTLGTIQFVPMNGRPVASKILTDGSFQLTELSVESRSPTTGVSQGKYRISVSASEVVNEDAGKVRWHVPAHYADFRTSGLEMDINGPNEELLLELTWEGSEEDESAGENGENTENPRGEEEAAAESTDENRSDETEATEEE